MKRIGFLLLLALVATVSTVSTAESEEPFTLFRALGWTTYGVSAADNISTEIALSKGAYEGNPFMRNRTVRIPYPILINYATEKARQKGHEKVALWMRIALIAGYGYVAAHNLRQGR